MVRETSTSTLYISVPSYFRCPISMDVMRSPVSLCTGVTYDRSSIQHWLESGHDTCPATNQPLPTRDLVPNLNLHRLINLWSVPPPRDHLDPVTCLVKSVASRSDGWQRSLSQIADLAAKNVRFLASSDGFVSDVASIMIDRDHEVEIGTWEAAVKILDTILQENGDVAQELSKSRTDLTSSMLAVLRRSPKARAGSCRIILAISALDSTTRDAVIVLVDVLRTSNDQELDEAAMACLVSMSASGGAARRWMAEAGLVEIITEKLEPSSGRISGRLLLRLVGEMARVAEGRAGIGGRLAGAAVERMMEAPEEAVGAIWAMCCVYREGRVVEAVRRSNGVTKVLVVMQSCGGGGGDDGRLRRMCRELLKVLGSSGFDYSVLGSYHTKTAHIMPY